MPGQYQTGKVTKYGGKPQTDAAREESLKRSIDFAIDTLKKASTGKVDLTNPDNIWTYAEVFLNACKEAGVIPTFEKFITGMGYSRQWIYKYMHDHMGSESVLALDNIHGIFNNVMTEQALYKNFSDAVTIFLLKNATGQDYKDRAEKETFVVRRYDLPPIEELNRLADLLPAGEENEEGLI